MALFLFWHSTFILLWFRTVLVCLFILLHHKFCVPLPSTVFVSCIVTFCVVVQYLYHHWAQYHVHDVGHFHVCVVKNPLFVLWKSPCLCCGKLPCLGCWKVSYFCCDKVSCLGCGKVPTLRCGKVSCLGCGKVPCLVLWQIILLLLMHQTKLVLCDWTFLWCGTVACLYFCTVWLPSTSIVLW